MDVFKGLALSALLAIPAAAVTVPRPASEFVIHMPAGGQQLLSQYKGKVVVLEFLFTTCPHCQQASQLMNKLQAEYGPKGFQALGVAFNDMAKMLVPDFVRDFKVTYPVGYTPREPVPVFLQTNPNESLHVPLFVFIDRKGVIRHQSLARGDTTTATEPFLRQTIEKLLSESTPAATKKPVAKKKTS